MNRVNPKIWLVMSAFLLGIAGTSFAERIIYVDADAKGLNNGSNWEDAYKYLQDGLADARSSPKPVEIRVAQGIYKPDQGAGIAPGVRTATFQLINGVTIKGGYAGFGEPDPDARDIVLYETILSGDIGNPSDKSDNCYHVFYHPEGLNLDTTAILDGFTITGGSGSSSYAWGGGMCNFYSSPRLENCSFSGNSAEYGGGMFNDTSNPTVKGCTFSTNSATYGGGICNWCSSPTVTNCTFSRNLATYGGGMDNLFSGVKVESCTFNANLGGYGGGMCNDGSSPTVTNCTNCTFSGNSASYGGGMCNFDSKPIVTNCILWADVPSEIYSGAPIVTFSDVQGGWSGTGNINADPCFVHPDSNDYHLLPKSPCINSGDPNYVAGPNETDMDGEPRVINGRVDIGVDEFNYEGPVLEISPRAFNFYCPEGGPNPEVQVLSILIRGADSLNWNVTEDCLWLQVSPVAGSSAGEIDEVVLSVDVNGLEGGEYSCILTVSSSNAINTPQYVTINLHVKTPLIGVKPTKFEFSCPVGGPNPELQILSIWNADIGILNWQINKDCSWLQVNPIVGSSTGEVDEVTLSVDVNGLEAGEYSCILTVSDSNAINTPQYVTVTLHVKAPIIGVNPTKFEFSCPVGGPNPKPQILSIWNADIGILNWQIIEDCSWLQASPTTGSSTGDIDKVTLTFDAAGLPYGNYTCDLTVSDDAAGNSPVTVPVTLVIYLERQLYVPADFPTIQAAIDDAHDGDTIIVADGIYSGNGNRDIDFKGKTIIVRSENGPESCIIDCNGTQTEPHRGFYFHNFEDANSVLDGFTITNGYATDSGGIFCMFHSSPTISNCTIRGNKSKYNGGGVFCRDGSNPTISNCSIIGNSSERDGGGIICRIHSSPVINNCTISGNKSNGSGGGVCCMDSSSPTITNCTISGNLANGGGGILNSHSSPMVRGCTFSANSARSGGGMCNDSYSSPTVTNCIFWADVPLEIYGGTPIVTYSDVQGAWTGTGNINADPCFVQPLPSGPIYYWKFDDGSGTTAYDSAGINNGTVYGATWTTGQIDGALSFDGVNDYVRIPNNQGRQITTNQITLSVWIKLGADVGNTQRGIICEQKQIDWDNYILWGLEIFGDGYGGSGGNQLVFLDSDGRTAYHTCMSPTDLNLNQWYHVAVTDNAGAIRIYLDGEPDWSCDKGYGIPSNVTAPIIIGATPATYQAMYHFFNGTIDDVRIHDRVLSDEEIRRLYQNGLPDFGVGDYHLRPDSPCINAGDPNYVPEPNETDMDGELRIMLGRVDMGADEFNPFEVTFDVNDRKRIGRTVFEYDCNVTLRNVSRFAVINVQLEVVKASENMVIIDPNVEFSNIEIGPGESAISIDTCSFQVDRSEAIKPAHIVWKSTCEMINVGQEFQDTALGTSFLRLENNAGDSKIDFEDLAALASQWLWVGEAGSIPEDVTGDGVINLADFAELAQNWQEGRP